MIKIPSKLVSLNFYATDDKAIFDQMANFKSNFASEHSKLSLITKDNQAKPMYYATIIFSFDQDDPQSFQNINQAIQTFDKQFRQCQIPNFSQWQPYQNINQHATFNQTIDLFNQFLKQTLTDQWAGQYLQIELGKDYAHQNFGNALAPIMFDNQNQQTIQEGFMTFYNPKSHSKTDYQQAKTIGLCVLMDSATKLSMPNIMDGLINLHYQWQINFNETQYNDLANRFVKPKAWWHI